LRSGNGCATKAGISGEDAASPAKLLNALYKKSETLLDTATNGKTERERVTAQNDIVKMAQSGVLADATVLAAQEQAQKKAAEQETARNRQNIERMQLDDELAAKRRSENASRLGEYRPTDEIRRIGGTLGNAVGNINGQKQLNATLTTNRLLQIIAQNQKNATGGGAATFGA
jgi:hypothetical protein